jgi:hypothetical protein
MSQTTATNKRASVASSALAQVRSRKASTSNSTKVDNNVEEKESNLTGTYLVPDFMKAFGLKFVPEFRINVSNYPFITFTNPEKENEGLNLYLSVKASNSLKELDEKGRPTGEFIYGAKEALNGKFFAENGLQIYQYTDETTGEDRFKIGLKQGEGSSWMDDTEVEA